MEARIPIDLSHARACDPSTESFAPISITDPDHVPLAAPASLPEPTLRRGCPFSDLRDKLRRVGLRPTRQRMSLGWLLFGKGDRHITAEMLYD